MARLPLLLLLPACITLQEVREIPEVIAWSGDILDGPYSDDAGPYTGGTLTVTDLDGAPLLKSDGTDVSPPEETAEGYWFIYVPVDTDVQIRLSGDGYVNTVWQSHTPTGRAYWYTGALFARTTEDTDALFTELVEAGLLAAAPGALADGAVTHLWGIPQTPEEWVGAQISVTDGAGVSQPVLSFAVDETDGTVRLATAEDPVAFFLATDLTPGEVSLQATGADGRTATLRWLCAGGDLLHPVFLALSESP